MPTSENSNGDRAHKRTVAVDLDGVLAQYTGWKGIDHIGDPIPGARAFLQTLRERFEVVIHSCRCNTELNREGANLLRNRIRDWLEKHDLPYDHIWAEAGKPAAVAYVDDRAVECRPEEHQNPVDAYADAIWGVRTLEQPPEPDDPKVPSWESGRVIGELADIRTELQRRIAANEGRGR